MGCGMSTGDSRAKARNDEIERQIKNDRDRMAREVKLLLLGAGESGKSTVLKQMKLINQGSYSETEREAYKEVVYSNTVQSMQVILEAMATLQVPFADERCEAFANVLTKSQNQFSSDALSPEVGDAIKFLWQDDGVRRCFKRSREYQLNDSAKYYFDSIDRIVTPDYLPSNQDVLRSRVKTTGITETSIQIGNMTYRIFDVGGQRPERKKWIHCFEDVTSLLFMVAISEYDQLLLEDESVNRMQEALTLFDSICNSRWFIRSSVILFLNKIDRFEEKLRENPMQKYFPDYTGGADLNSAREFIKSKFMALNRNYGPNGVTIRPIYTHFTCATDTEKIKYVMDAVNDTIIKQNLINIGLVS